MAALVPQLGDLQEAPRCRLLERRAREEAEPHVVQALVGAQHELREQGRLSQLAQVEDHASALRDEVEVLRELLRVEHQRMVGTRDEGVLPARRCCDLLADLHGQVDAGHQDAVRGHLHLRLVHHEPLPGTPGIAAGPDPLVVEVQGAPHADDRLVVLAHGQLLQVVVGLEHDLANTGSRQPLGLEALHLHGRLRHELILGGLDGVQGEEGLAARRAADLESDGQVL
mmetsp:Transcript_90740/g.255808  ORF Transcript_90740/g.255808 Transcript_90740/m.255808 type:complete len:227 (-) Transcript_90740:377-1057(-)